MTYLVIPDIHNRVEEAEHLVRTLGKSVNHVVFLGDYFDNYGDTPDDARKTAQWLKYSLQQDNRTHLMGNHDIPYSKSYRTCPCPGYTRDKALATYGDGSLLTCDDWDKLAIFKLIPSGRPDVRPMLLSHAGFTLTNLYGLRSTRKIAKGGSLRHLKSLRLQVYLDDLKKEHKACLDKMDDSPFKEDQHHWLNRGSRCKDGDIAGPMWLDRDDFIHPIPGIDQIIGHTYVSQPRRHSYPCAKEPNAEAWFIDRAGMYAAIVDTDGSNGKGGMSVTVIHARGDMIGEPV